MKTQEWRCQGRPERDKMAEHTGNVEAKRKKHVSNERGGRQESSLYSLISSS